MELNTKINSIPSQRITYPIALKLNINTMQQLKAQHTRKIIPCSLRAVKIMVPVSSPTRHLAMRQGAVFTGEQQPTFTVRVCPSVPGFRSITRSSENSLTF